MDYDPLFADGSDLETEDTPQEFSPLNSDIWRYGNTLIETPWSVPRTDESSSRTVNHPVQSTPTSSEMGRKRYFLIKKKMTNCLICNYLLILIYFHLIYFVRSLLSGDNNLRMKTGKPDTNRSLSYPRTTISNRLYRPPRYGQNLMPSPAYTPLGTQENLKYPLRSNSQAHTTTTPSDHSIASSSNPNRMININPQTSPGKI